MGRTPSSWYQERIVCVSAAYIDTHLEAVQRASMILVQLETPLEAVVRLAEQAWEAKAPLMLDPAPARPLPEALLSRTTWLTPNETEAQILLGRVNIDPAAAAEKLLAMGVRNVALKLGSQGVFLAGRDCPAQQVPAFTVKAVDTTAAGDCFNAAFAVALTRGKPPAVAARYAAAAAAISVTRAGAQPSLPTARKWKPFSPRRASRTELQVGRLSSLWRSEGRTAEFTPY